MRTLCFVLRSVLIHLLPGLALAARRHVPAAAVAAAPSGAAAAALARRLLARLPPSLASSRVALELVQGLGALQRRGVGGGGAAWWWQAGDGVRWGWDGLGTCCPLPGAGDASAVLHVCCGWRGWAAWLAAAPLAFYLAWQLVYFLVVQVRGHWGGAS